MAAGAWAWESGTARAGAEQRLADFVRDLTRARRLQLFVECAWGGLFFGLLAACVPVLAVRLGGLAWPQWPAAALFLALSFCAAALLAWRRRPGDLEVSIFADLELKLEQKLSTAWEFARRDPGTPLAERLAAQALAQRMPVTHQVFPLRLNTWGRLAPLAALVLALVGLMDFGARTGDSPLAIDPVVADEGVRLREHGRRMEARARQESLPRSQAQAGALQRLGARMESGASPRRQALTRLRELSQALVRERRMALPDGLPADIARLPAQSLAGLPVLSDGRLGALLAGLRQGTLTRDDVEALGAEVTRISALGIAPAELEEALARFAAGEHEALRRLLEKLSEAGTALREAVVLWDAEEAVRRARENLGERGLLLGGRGEGAGEPGGGDGPAAWLNARLAGTDDGDVRAFAALRGPGRGHGAEPAERLRSPSPRPVEAPGDVALEVKGRPGEGQVFSTEARVLPRPGRVSVPVTALDPRFHDELETVLARQYYPLRHKALVRRYFLALSEGAAGGRETEGAR